MSINVDIVQAYSDHSKQRLIAMRARALAIMAHVGCFLQASPGAPKQPIGLNINMHPASDIRSVLPHYTRATSCNNMPCFGLEGRPFEKGGLS